MPYPQHDANAWYERELAKGWEQLDCDIQVAVDTFTSLIRRNPRDARPRLGLGIARGLLGHYSRAERLISHAIRDDPAILDCNPARFNISDVWSSLRENGYQTLQRDGCDRGSVLFVTAVAHWYAGQYPAAWSALDRAVYFGACGEAVDLLQERLLRQLPASYRYRSRRP